MGGQDDNKTLCVVPGLPGFDARFGTGSAGHGEGESPIPRQPFQVWAPIQDTSAVLVLIGTHKENLADFLLLCLQIFWL